jgi:hypothetical protein
MKKGVAYPGGTGEISFAAGVRRCGPYPEQTWP